MNTKINISIKPWGVCFPQFHRGTSVQLIHYVGSTQANIVTDDMITRTGKHV